MNSSTQLRDTPVSLLTGIGSRLLPVRGGRAQITTTSNRSGALVARCLGLRPGATVPGALTITEHDDGEHWQRQCATSTRTTLLRNAPTPRAAQADEILEQAGPIELRFDVSLDRTWTTVMSLRSMRLGWVRLPVMRFVSVVGRIAPDGTTDVAVRVGPARCNYHVHFEAER